MRVGRHPYGSRLVSVQGVLTARTLGLALAAVIGSAAIVNTSSAACLSRPA